MSGVTVEVKLSEDKARLLDELVELGLAGSREEALTLLLEKGAAEARRMIARRRRVLRLLERLRREGPPAGLLPTAADVEEARERG